MGLINNSQSVSQPTKPTQKKKKKKKKARNRGPKADQNNQATETDYRPVAPSAQKPVKLQTSHPTTKDKFLSKSSSSSSHSLVQAANRFLVPDVSHQCKRGANFQHPHHRRRGATTAAIQSHFQSQEKSRTKKKKKKKKKKNAPLQPKTQESAKQHGRPALATYQNHRPPTLSTNSRRFQLNSFPIPFPACLLSFPVMRASLEASLHDGRGSELMASAPQVWIGCAGLTAGM